MNRDRSVEPGGAKAAPFFSAPHGGLRRAIAARARMLTAALAFLVPVGANAAVAVPIEVDGPATSAFESRDTHQSAAVGHARPGQSAPLAEQTRGSGGPPPAGAARRGGSQPRQSPTSLLRSPAADATAQTTNRLILGFLYDLHAIRAGLCAFCGVTPPPLRVLAGA